MLPKLKIAKAHRQRTKKAQATETLGLFIDNDHFCSNPALSRHQRIASSAPFSIARCTDGSLDFSYSGLKSQALVEIQKLETDGVQSNLGDMDLADVPGPVLDLLAGFRMAAVGQLVDRLNRLRRERPIQHLAVSGGVAANRLLRPRLEAWSLENEVTLHLVPLRYSGDNAAMIAHAALLRDRRGLTDDPLVADAASRIPL